MNSDLGTLNLCFLLFMRNNTKTTIPTSISRINKSPATMPIITSDFRTDGVLTNVLSVPVVTVPEEELDSVGSSVERVVGFLVAVGSGGPVDRNSVVVVGVDSVIIRVGDGVGDATLISGAELLEVVGIDDADSLELVRVEVGIGSVLEGEGMLAID